jgi:4-nitrophenyl phosphatase
VSLSNIRTLLLDGDGVLWHDDQKLPGFDHLFHVLEKYAVQWALITNNNTRSVRDYVNKLSRFGVKVDASRIFSSSTIAAAYLARKHGHGASVFVVGMPGLIETMQEAGFDVYHGEKLLDHPVSAVVAGMDRAINHDKIKAAMRLIMEGAEFIATNTDGSFPTPDGINPGTGMVIGAIQATTEVQPTVVGKPELEIFQTALDSLGAEPETTWMVGDRLNTDILGVQRAGIQTIAVLTGVATLEDIQDGELQPDIVFSGIDELTAALEKRLSSR